MGCFDPFWPLGWSKWGFQGVGRFFASLGFLFDIFYRSDLNNVTLGVSFTDKSRISDHTRRQVAFTKYEVQRAKYKRR